MLSVTHLHNNVLNIKAKIAPIIPIIPVPVDDEQHNSQEEDGAYGDVGDAEERVLPPHPGNGAQDHPLVTIEAQHWVIVRDFQLIVATG